jgi:hypothetical protein
MSAGVADWPVRPANDGISVLRAIRLEASLSCHANKLVLSTVAAEHPSDEVFIHMHLYRLALPSLVVRIPVVT